MPKDALIAQVKKWNEMVAQGKDTEFDRALALAVQLDKAPYYACRVWPKVHYCMGGVAINHEAQVLTAMGQPIEGLWAAGEVTGGTHGASRLGGCAIADGLVFGRIAAQSAIKAPVYKF